MARLLISTLCLLTCLAACAGPLEGPDKQFGGALEGALTGAGTGAVTGFHVASASGPGAAIGAGLGALAGGVSGFAQDQIEEDLLLLSRRVQKERALTVVHEILQDHYRRRLELFPTRDIYPADLFFYGDDYKVRPDREMLIQEIALLNKRRLPWSRLAVVAYVKGEGKPSDYARHLVEKRSRAIVNQMVRFGLEPRRLEAQGVVIEAPLVLDPSDSPSRYSQAIELVPLDR